MTAAWTIGYGQAGRSAVDMRQPRKYVVDRTPTPEPWDVTSFSPSTGIVTLETGDVEIHGETQAGTTTSYVTPASLTLTISTSGTVYLWVAATWSGSAWSAALASGTSKPVAAEKVYRKLLWSFLNGVPAKRWHRGNVEFVGWRMLE